MRETYTYPAISIVEANGHSWLFFPDLPGCIAYGETENEAMSMAKIALGYRLFELEQSKSRIPGPSRIADLSPAHEQDIVLIETSMSLIRKHALPSTVQKTVTMPLWLDRLARGQDVDYSKLLQAALMEHLKIGKP